MDLHMSFFYCIFAAVNQKHTIMNNFFKDAALFIGGALVGAAAAMLFTTEKGKEVRSQIADLANEAAERAQDYCEQVKDKWAEVTAEKAEPAQKEAGELSK